MIKCKQFSQTREIDGFTIVYSPMYNFNKWDQKNVKTIHTIKHCYNNNGECTQIIVFYEPKDTVDEQ